MGRALSAGKAPTIPALHWAITSAGCETMNNGAPTTGSLSLPFRISGSAIEVPQAAACKPSLAIRPIVHTKTDGDGASKLARRALTSARSTRRKDAVRRRHEPGFAQATARASVLRQSEYAAD